MELLFRLEGSELTLKSRLIKGPLTCNCSKMVESTPDPGDGHCGIEVWLSEQRGRNHLWGRRFWQIRTFPKNAVSPDKHLTFIWRTQTKYALFQMIKSMRSRSPSTQRKTYLMRNAPCGYTGNYNELLQHWFSYIYWSHRRSVGLFSKCWIACPHTWTVQTPTNTKISLHHLICGQIWVWNSRIN